MSTLREKVARHQKERDLKSKVKSHQKSKSDDKDGVYAQDIVVPAVMGATLGFADELTGAGNVALEKFKGSDKSMKELYESGRDNMRGRYQESMERSPKTAFGAELIGSAISPASKVLPGFKGIGRESLEGLLSGMGASEDKIGSGKNAAETILGGAVGAGTKMAGNVIKSAIPDNPNAVRANVMGSNKSHFLEKGIKDREALAGELKEKGFFGGGHREFNAKTGKFEARTTSLLEGGGDMDLTTPERLQSRATRAIEAIKSEKDEIWRKVGDKKITQRDLDRALREAASEYEMGHPRWDKATEAAQELKSGLELTLATRNGPGNPISLKSIDELKADLYDYTRYGKSHSDLPDADVMNQIFARKLKDLVNDKIGDTRFKDLNNSQGNFFTARSDLDGKLAALKGAGATAEPKIDLWNTAQKSMANALGGDDFKLGQADLSEMLGKIPLPMRESVKALAAESPETLFRQQIADPSSVFGGDRAPDSVEEFQAPEGYMDTLPEMDMGIPEEVEGVPTFELPGEISEPYQQSLEDVDPLQSKIEEVLNPQKPTALFDPYINEEVLNLPLPRSTDRLLQNREVLRAKLGQNAPQYLPVLDDILENDPESAEDMLPKLAMMVPSVFERDKYNMFDGKILDPVMQEKFLMDLSQDESMDSISKAKMAMKLKRGESIHG